MISDSFIISGDPDLSLQAQTFASAIDLPSSHSDSNLIARTLNGEISLFHLLVSPCERSMFFIALSLLRNEADAEDAVQQSVLKALRSLAGFRHEASFKTWIIRITINEAKTMLRKRRRFAYESLDTRDDSESEEGASRDVPDRQACPLETLLRKEAGEVLTTALSALPAKYRIVVMLRDIEGFDTEETAQMLGVSQANVKTRLCRARLRLRETIIASRYEENRAFAYQRPYLIDS